MRIYDRHPLPWAVIEVLDKRAVIQDATFEFVAEFETLGMARWALDAMTLSPGADSELGTDDD